MLVWYAPDAIHFGIVAHDRLPVRDPRHGRRPRQHRQRGPGRPRHRHLPRPPPRLLLRRQSARRAERRRAERGRGAGEQPDPRQRRQESRLHLGLERPDHRAGLRDRDPDSLQEPAISPGGEARAGASTSPASSSAPATPTPGPTCGGPTPASSGRRARIGGLHDMRHGVTVEAQPFITATANGSRDLASGQFRPRGRRSRRGAQPAPRLHQLRARRDDQPRLQPGGERRGPGHGERALRPLLPGEAAVLPRRHRAVRHAAVAGLHPPDRGPQGRRQAHRQVRPARRGASDRGG